MNKQQKQQLVDLCTEHFFTHPHWESLLSLIELYIEPLKSISTLETKNKHNDEIATELKARQITVDSLSNFIRDSLVVRANKEKSVQNTTRKYK